ncbi:MAG: ATP-binding protein [Cytophagia bacterium]|nr:MAG: ATP-binding protein [Cytophagales bacterium]TAG40506.1 MAG: ATP-binding protein [Cytophagia bacterium]TAG77493.1 MAG: ATP-binding protein [Cytophagales bacterium]
MKSQTKIIGRILEIQKLNKILESSEAEFLSVYGRRRVGKTFLIREFFNNQLVFDFTGTKDAHLQAQLNNFFEEYLKKTKGNLKTQTPKTWQEAFLYLADYLYSLKSDGSKMVVFIDEMPWLDTPKSGFISALEYFWNQHLSKMNHIILVACGSASSWIRKNLINARGGLYNRVTQRMRLAPFDLLETEKYLQSKGIQLPRYQIVELFMALGGIPFYLKYVEAGKSSTQLIDELCFWKDAPLQEEYKQLYYSLFKNAENHEKIVEILASKPQGLTRQDIQQQSKIANGTLSRTLEELVECDFVGIFQPFDKKKKDSIYKLIDNFSLFYAKFIKNQTFLNQGLWMALSKESSYGAWSGYAFENICFQHLPKILKALGINGISVNACSWKTRDGNGLGGTQIDLLIDRADKAISICEAKFSSNNYLVTKEYANHLRMRKSIFQHTTQTKKAIFNTLITPFPAIRNEHYLDQFQAEVNLEAFFDAG